MTNLTFAIEAAKRGCPYVSMAYVDEISVNDDDLRPCFNPDPRENQWTFMCEYDNECISEDMLSRFACGATLCLWWDEQYSKEHEEFQSYPYHDNHKSELSRKCDECVKHRDAARSFAKGL